MVSIKYDAIVKACRGVAEDGRVLVVEQQKKEGKVTQFMNYNENKGSCDVAVKIIRH